MRIQAKFLAILLPVIFALGIGGTMIFNLWITEASKVPAVYEEGDFAGQADPGDIRGSYSFADIENAYSVPAEVIASAFGLSEEDNFAEFQCKMLEDRYGAIEEGEVGTDSVRYFVALYLDLPYEPEEDTLLLSPSIPLLKDRVAPEILESLRNRTATVREVLSDEAESETEHNTEDMAVKGGTTFKELYDWGLSNEEVAEILGIEPGPAGGSVRDYCIQNGIEFSSVKSILQEFVDSKN